jgi:hypothetical protein
MEAKNILDVIPLIPKVTSVKAYTPYRHSKLFLQTKYTALPKDGKGLPRDLAVIMEKTGYKNRVKFLRRLREEWLQARDRVPWNLLGSLDISGKDLLWILEFDKEDWRGALNHANRPRGFHFRVSPCCYPWRTFPENISEEGAIGYVKEFMKDQPDHIRRTGAWFTYRDIKTVVVHEDGRVGVSYYEPAIIIEHSSVMFTSERVPGTAVVT